MVSTRLFMIGGSSYQQLEVHRCAYPTVFGGPTAIALVHRDPDVWMLQALAATGYAEPARNALVLIRFCPWCGVKLALAEAESPPLVEPATEDEPGFLRCVVVGCERSASEPPHLRDDGSPICPQHASELAGGKCAMCSREFDPQFNGFDVYPLEEHPHEGKAACIDCWGKQNLLSHPPKRRVRRR